MINISELRVVEDAFIGADIIYEKSSLYSLLETHFREENTYSEESMVKFRHLVKGNKDMAYNTIMRQDLARIKKAIASVPKQFDEQLWMQMLPKIRKEIKKILGLEFKPRSLFFRKHFPLPLISYEKKGASSVTVFEGQRGAGIYFLERRISSFFTPFFIIHEQLHSCLSQNKTREQIYIEWFEEGLCQWYSLIIYHRITKNDDVLNMYRARAHLYSQVKGPHNLTRRYFEYMKLMSRLYQHGGKELIGRLLLSYLSNERDKVNKYLNVQMLKIRMLPETDMEQFLVNFPFFVEPETIPPLEYLILKHTREPKTIGELSSVIKVPAEVIEKVLLFLQLNGLVIVKDKEIEINWRKKDLLEKGLIKPFWPLKK